jgi:hypothetical protein
MKILDQLSSDQKYAISKIMDGTLSVIEEMSYCSDYVEAIAAAVVIVVEENGWAASVEDVIEKLTKYKEEKK